jgi:adenylylsulfate kinase
VRAPSGALFLCGTLGIFQAGFGFHGYNNEADQTAEGTSMTSNIQWHQASVTRANREHLNGHRSFVLWFTGLSGAGKSTLAHRVEEILFERACRTYVFDGDNVRHGLCRDLGFSSANRKENIRRIGEMSKLFVDAGVIALTAFISPFREDRDMVRKLLGENEFIEVFCNAALEVCEERDVKGLYQKARRGEIPEFTGISSPYEAPLNPEITVHTGSESLEQCAQRVIDFLAEQQYIKP